MSKQSRLKILLVEDSRVSQMVVLKQLKKLGYEAESAANGQEALGMMARSNYDIVLLDCQMPVLDGYETISKIRELEGRGKHTIAIAITTNGMIENRDRCLHLGMDDYLIKPVSEQELGACLEHWSQVNLTGKNDYSQIELTTAVPGKLLPRIDEADVNGIVDLNRLNDITLGNVNLQIEILQAFVEDAQMNLTGVKTAISVQDFLTVEHKAHQIKGGSANVGVQSMQAIALAMESQAKQKSLEGVPELLIKIEKHLERVQAFTSRMIQGETCEPESTLSLTVGNSSSTQVSSMAKILIIDDDPSVLLVIKNSLQLMGHEVTVASNGEDGLTKARQLHPHLIICDWMMPALNGLEVCRQIKSDPELSVTFFILLTIRGDVKDRVEGLDTGADEYLSKPIDMSELRARVRAGLRSQGLMQELRVANKALLQANQQLTARNELLESLSLTDQLTGLLNRRAMDRALPHMLRQVGNRDANTRYRYLCLFVIDVDYFKRVNDTHGHSVGDSVLQAIAGRLQSNARPNSQLYRYGGEEFVCITQGLSPEAAWEYGEFLRSCIAKDPIKVSENLLLSVSISIGGAIASGTNLVDSQTLLRQADRCLYQAKGEGRNCLRMFCAWSNVYPVEKECTNPTYAQHC
jgi:diguanylate cyclase (GGDEF)-like protein